MTPIVLEATSVWYHSQHDEAAFFEWLDKLACVEKYEGEGETLYIHLDAAKVNQASLRELLALFRRYKVDMKQLRIFEKRFGAWFRDPRTYWFKAIFGK